MEAHSTFRGRVCNGDFVCFHPVVVSGKKRVRADVALVAQGLCPSRERARALILAGEVLDGDRPVGKAGDLVAPDAPLRLRSDPLPFVSRGGVKLQHALGTFGLDVRGMVALDIGASTGGFTDALLQRGAARVIALDVGHGQFDWTLRNDPRVVVMEHFNARRLTPGDLPGPVDVVVVDVSFISLRRILPVIPPLLRRGADVIALVKPQFEAGRADVRKGVVRDPAVHARVLEEVAAAAREVGLTPVGSVPSPIAGAKGNREFLLHLHA